MFHTCTCIHTFYQRRTHLYAQTNMHIHAANKYAMELSETCTKTIRACKTESYMHTPSWVKMHSLHTLQAKLDQAILWLFRGTPLIVRSDDDD
jgi:hypothetical protein